MLAVTGRALRLAAGAVLAAVLALGLVFAAGTAASAHAAFGGSVARRYAVLSVLAGAVPLTCPEPVAARASMFNVYPLEPDEDRLRLRAQAARLVDEVLQLRGDEERRGDAGVQAAGREAAEIRIVLKDGLPPGPYVVMWRVLSIDTHITWEIGRAAW